MCLSTVYTLGMGGSLQKIGEYVTTLNVVGDTITFAELMGAETSIKGTFQSVDLIKNKIVIEEQRQSN
ncbi:hypothetical protein FACS1894190_11660 [Spirochaetia bacterium]|nr:hypothetical protein FACS1894190_11660 [Spirochaetia bacterium]